MRKVVRSVDGAAEADRFALWACTLGGSVLGAFAGVLRGPSWGGVLSALGLPITSAWQGVVVALIGAAIGGWLGRQLALRRS